MTEEVRPKSLRPIGEVAKDLARLDKNAFEVAIPVGLLAELIYYGCAASTVDAAVQSCGLALARAVIDGAAVATPYRHALIPTYEAVMARARSEHILLNLGTPEVLNYPREEKPQA